MGDQITTLDADVVNVQLESPYVPGQQIRISALTAATVYSADRQSRNEDDKTVEARGDGVQVTWDENSLAPLANADIPAQAAITPITALTVIVLVPDVHGDMIVPLLRVGSDTAPGAGEFRIVDNGGTTEIEFGEAPWDFRLQVIEAADVVTLTGGALTANRPYQVDARPFLTTANADVTIERLLC